MLPAMTANPLDLRSWLDEVRELGELKEVRGADWNLELGAGRYIGTGCSVVTRDFDSDWTNVGTYRVMVVDRNHVALDMVPGKHGRIHYEKHKQAGKRLPVAIVLGGDPLGYLISGIEVP